MEALFFIILHFLTTFWLLNSKPNLEPEKEFHISFSSCVSPFNLRSNDTPVSLEIHFLTEMLQNAKAEGQPNSKAPLDENKPSGA